MSKKTSSSKTPQDLKVKFDKAVNQVRTSKAAPVDNDIKLSLYGSYKQATEGNNEASEPYRIQLETHAKWTAWKKFYGWDKPSAQQFYIDLVKQSKI